MSLVLALASPPALLEEFVENPLWTRPEQHQSSQFIALTVQLRTNGPRPSRVLVSRLPGQSLAETTPSVLSAQLCFQHVRCPVGEQRHEPLLTQSRVTIHPTHTEASGPDAHKLYILRSVPSCAGKDHAEPELMTSGAPAITATAALVLKLDESRLHECTRKGVWNATLDGSSREASTKSFPTRNRPSLPSSAAVDQLPQSNSRKAAGNVEESQYYQSGTPGKCRHGGRRVMVDTILTMSHGMNGPWLPALLGNCSHSNLLPAMGEACVGSRENHEIISHVA